MRAALARLPEEQSRAVVLAGLLGYTAREVGEIEDIPLGTAKTRIRTALLRLRAALVSEERHGMTNVSALSCAEVRELAPELALGILGGAERAEVVLHVNGCARCQAYVAELTEAADAIPQLAPEAEPPAGFERRVLHRLGEARAPHPAPLDRGRRRRRRRPPIIVSITVVRVIESERHATSQQPGTTPTIAAKPVAVSMQLTGALALPAGWAYVMRRPRRRGLGRLRDRVRVGTRCRSSRPTGVPRTSGP